MLLDRYWDLQQVFKSRGRETTLTISYGEQRKAFRQSSLDEIQQSCPSGFTIKVTAYGIRYDGVCHIEKEHLAFQHAMRDAIWEQKKLLEAGIQESLDLQNSMDPESGNEEEKTG